MVTLAVFAVGFFTGAALGVFSLIILEAAVCAVAFVSGWHTGFVANCANSVELGAVLGAGFLVALAISSLSPKFELEVAHWLRRQPDPARDRRVMHGRQ